MKGSIKVLFWLYKSKKNGQGLIPLYLRITLDSARIHVASGYSILARHWNNKKKVVSDAAPQGAEINNALQIQRSRLVSIYNQLLASQKGFTLDTLKDKFLGKGDEHKSLLYSIQYHNKKVSELVGKSYAKGTYANYVYLADKISGFLQYRYGKKDIPLNQLNKQFLIEFEQYLRAVHNNNTNTVAKGMTNLKTIVNMAMDMEWIEKDPFRNHRNKKEEPPRTYLTEDEVRILVNSPMSNVHLQVIKDCMIFQIYTGLAYADLKNLSPANVIIGVDGDQWLDLRRQKTHTRTTLPLLPQAAAILKKYGDQAKAKDNARLLPVISNQKMNSQIKKVIELCIDPVTGTRIQKNISSHSLRRTFATTITLSKGIPIETVSKMLGHKDLKTTAIYAKVVDTKISDDMRKLMTI